MENSKCGLCKNLKKTLIYEYQNGIKGEMVHLSPKCRNKRTLDTDNCSGFESLN